mmetsp:Transcript_7816/g.22244  ORF Transcript_7816/g.22244 Transcript_7816/m.22244 type:complete len:275 (-) Transcript_7816:129-953(-)|eukprot:CAMPEP_0176233402 /NCGR_PEP_ID=MMETSP0121_2-20121125/25803_1 /TAXON_ID=160619 /ORGANISM="Kryptoperidinium foliaceum, Strain CCMP 1326" /LENGTH=274 /DNA_ID=CAMNT_0017572789 /DNA_START=56 /DNA_END=880 /DNA_ORIENTATION=+
MGTFAKRLGQLSTKSLESESKNILRTCAANKVPGSLSLALDGTLKQGHDMRVFGLGTAASMASRERYARFTTSMLAVYRTMEQELDETAAVSELVRTVWGRHGGVLRRAAALEADLADVADPAASAEASPATARYVEGLRAAGLSDRMAVAAAAPGAKLLGHLYCRYFADLFGGQVLALPTRVALGLEAGTPRHYTFEMPADIGRRALIEEVYGSLNEAGALLSEEAFGDVVKESLKAFELNVGVYSEEPMMFDAVRGAFNVSTGFVGHKLRGG